MSRVPRVAFALALALAAAPVARADFDWAGRIALDAEALTSESTDDRLAAVAQLSSYDIAHTKKWLLRALADDQPSVRHEAGRVLGRAKVVEATPIVVAWLGDADPTTRAIAAEILGNLGGDAATSALVRTLGDSDAGVRLRAVGALARIGRAGNLAVVVPLLSRLKDDKADVRREAIDQLRSIGDRRAVVPIATGLSDTSREVRKSAVNAIGALGDATAVPALSRLLSDDDEEVQAAAVSALGTLGAVDAADALIALLATSSGGVRSRSDGFRGKVAYALGQIVAAPGSGKAGQAAARALVEALGAPAQRAAVFEALTVAGKAAVPALVAHLEGRGVSDTASVVALLGSAADRRATSALVAELERGRVPIVEVLRALGEIRDPAALVPVLDLLGSDAVEIRLAVMNALRSLIGTDTRTGDLLIPILRDPELEIRVLAAEYLGALKAPRAVPALMEIAADKVDLRLRLAAVDALGRLGVAAAAPTLLSILERGPVALRAAAAIALVSIADPATIPPLRRLARGPRPEHALDALAGVVRGRSDEESRTLFSQLAGAGDPAVALAAIDGLAALHAYPELERLLDRGGDEQQRAALRAFAEQGAVTKGLEGRLASQDDRVASAAARALWRKAERNPQVRLGAEETRRLAHAVRFGGWATAINAAAALAAWSGRSDAQPDAIATLTLALHHPSPLVATNAALALAGVTQLPETSISALVAVAKRSSSRWVREAALRALRAKGAVPPELAKAAVPVAPPPAASDWRVFHVVDDNDDATPIANAPYFVRNGQGLIHAVYTDARGQIRCEQVAQDDVIVAAQAQQADY